MADEDKKFIGLFLEMLNCYEFRLYFKDDEFYVKDLQGGNLGNIESEEFETLKDVCSRMEVYHNDYLLKEVEQDKEISLWDMACLYLSEHDDYLKDCNVQEFKKYLIEKHMDILDYEQKDKEDDNIGL